MIKFKIANSAWFGGASLVALALGSALPGTVMAAEPSAAPPSAPVLSEVIVTAQHRSENVQKAALAVDVVSTNKLEVIAANRASDLVNLVPALQIGESGQGQQSLYLRGVGTFTANSYSDPAIAFNVDGIAIARPSSMSGVMYDLSRVEVVKGPQGTLYGPSSMGGLFKFVTVDPLIITVVPARLIRLTVGLLNYRSCGYGETPDIVRGGPGLSTSGSVKQWISS